MTARKNLFRRKGGEGPPKAEGKGALLRLTQEIFYLRGGRRRQNSLIGLKENGGGRLQPIHINYTINTSGFIHSHQKKKKKTPGRSVEKKRMLGDSSPKGRTPV